MSATDSIRVGPAQRAAVRAFSDRGCVRTPNKDRLNKEPGTYKKGWEIRFAVRSKHDLVSLRRVLQDAGLKAGSSYCKSETTWILPVYGREQVARFLGWVKATDSR